MSTIAGTPSKRLLAIAVALVFSGLNMAWAADTWTINIPRHSELSPVQRLNRDGVQAVIKHEYEKAEALFYKAYLYDPADPFTLNNLGYVSELEGQLDRARKFYDLAAEQGSDANIDLSNAKRLQGKPMKSALVNLQDSTMRVNRMNVNAMRMISEGRGFEAAALLKQTLALDPQNPFTLNNLGVANEAIGNYQDALNYYRQAANTRSTEPVVVSMDRSWRGKPVSQMAEDSAKKLEARMQQGGASGDLAAMLAFHGVYALNQNDWDTARKDFLRAYSLDPGSAFSLNNLGYVAEKEGDLETAQFFYEKARKAGNANASVGLATQLAAEGKSLSSVATDSHQKVDDALDQYSRERKRETAPVELVPRGGAEPADQPQNPQ
jgi:Flp pilus assembly protein TadD